MRIALGVIGVLWVLGAMRELFFAHDHWAEIVADVRANPLWGQQCPAWVFAVIIFVFTVIAWPVFFAHEMRTRLRLRRQDRDGEVR